MAMIVTLRKPIMVANMAERRKEKFRISLSPGTYELVPVNFSSDTVVGRQGQWLVIKGTQYGLTIDEWKTQVQDWPA